MNIRKGDISYRRAGIDDVETLVKYRVRFLNEMDNHPDDDEAKRLSKTLREYFSRALPSNEFIAWLAEQGGEIIGTSSMVVWRLPPRYGGLEDGRAGYLLNFYTVPEARRRGICTRLLKEIIEEAKTLGLRYLHLHASKDGIAIYRKASFAEPGQPELKLILKGKQK